MIREASVSQPIDVSTLQLLLVTRDEGTSVPFAPGLDGSCHFLFAQTCDTFYYSARSCGYIPNEHLSSPSGLCVLSGLNASGLCVPRGQTWQLWTK